MSNAPFTPQMQQMVMQRLGVNEQQFSQLLQQAQSLMQQTNMSPQQIIQERLSNGQLSQEAYNYGRNMANNITGMNF